MASNVELQGTKLKLELDWAINKGRDVRGERDYFELWNSSGAIAFCSPALQEIHLPPFGNSLNDAPQFRWLSLGKGIEGRALGVTFQPERNDESDEETQSAVAAPAPAEHTDLPSIATPAKNPTLTLVLVRDVAPLNATLAFMRMILFVVGCCTAAISSAVLIFIISKNLRPLEKLQHDISLLDANDLSARIHSPNLPQELVPLVARMNELLGRLETAFERERGFSADIAHELRTPLAGLRATIEVCLARHRPPDDYRNALSECQQITVQLQSLVENLLSLVRMESEEHVGQLETISTNAFLQDQWAPFASIAEQRNLHVEWMLAVDQPLSVDVTAISIALQNLFANAVEYTDEGGWIKIASNCTHEQWAITLANTGSCVSQEDVENVFDRFWRGDRARSNVGMHFGLGLSLVKRMITAMGGAVRVQSKNGGVFSVAILIPTSHGVIENQQIEIECVNRLAIDALKLPSMSR